MDEFLPLFFAKKLAASLILPPVGPILATLVGALIASRLPRTGRLLFWSGILSALLLTTPFASSLLLSGLEDIPPVDIEAAKKAQAIVILSGASYNHAPEYGGADTVGLSTLQRVRYGARLAKQTGLPVLVSGGAPSGGTPIAQGMRETLEREFGVPVRWTESASIDTRENALYSHDILKKAKIGHIVLVTDASHMRRAREYFQRAGFEVVAAPTSFASPHPSVAYDFLPGNAAMNQSSAALHELLGMAAIRLGIDAAR